MSIPMFLTRRRWVALSLAMAAAVTVILSFLIWPDEGPQPPPLVSAADYSGRTRLCLAFDDDEHGRGGAVTVRDAMRATTASLSTNIQELAIPVNAPQEAPSYLAGLAAQHCALIVTVGPMTARGIPVLTAADPTLHFLVVDSPSNTQEPTVTVVGQQDLKQVLATQIATVSSSAPTR